MKSHLPCSSPSLTQATTVSESCLSIKWMTLHTANQSRRTVKRPRKILQSRMKSCSSNRHKELRKNKNQKMKRIMKIKTKRHKMSTNNNLKSQSTSRWLPRVWFVCRHSRHQTRRILRRDPSSPKDMTQRQDILRQQQHSLTQRTTSNRTEFTISARQQASFQLLKKWNNSHRFWRRAAQWLLWLP